MTIAFTILCTVCAVTVIMWSLHVSSKNDEIDFLNMMLKDAKDRQDRVDAMQKERIPLRTKCRCKHDAYEHGNRGCNNWMPILGECSCLATQEQVMYDPEPTRKMVAL